VSERAIVRCGCRCHTPPGWLSWPVFVDTSDPLEAAAACDRYRAAHSPALLSTATANAPIIPPRERTPWVDPPRSSDDVGEDGG